ncbi:unnamed protein product, partial [Iphiclides podalirius]
MKLHGQVAIVTGLMLCSITDGYIFGQMSGMVNALLNANGLSEDDVSWIASTMNATCVSGFAIAGLITEKLGRRRAIVLMNLPVLATWVMIYYSTSLTAFLASRLLVGVGHGGIIFLQYVSMAEYATPSKRAVFINIISAVGPALGMTMGHILCILLHWRTVALLGIVPTGLSMLLPLFWVESPSWLASKGRFEECERAFRELHGCNDATEAELKLLLIFEQSKQKEFSAKKQFVYATVEKLSVALKQRYFWKVVMLCVVENGTGTQPLAAIPGYNPDHHTSVRGGDDPNVSGSSSDDHQASYAWGVWDSQKKGKAALFTTLLGVRLGRRRPLSFAENLVIAPAGGKIPEVCVHRDDLSSNTIDGLGQRLEHSSVCLRAILSSPQEMPGMVDALRAKNDGMNISENDVSWIASTMNVTCIFGLGLAGLVTEKVGRRRAITILSMPMLLVGDAILCGSCRFDECVDAFRNAAIRPEPR